jgi:hypothetical protein
VPKKSKPAKQRPLYKQKLPKLKGSRPQRPVLPRRFNKKADQQVSPTSKNDFVQAKPIPAALFELREDGSIVPAAPHPDPLLGERAGMRADVKYKFIFSKLHPGSSPFA